MASFVRPFLSFTVPMSRKQVPPAAPPPSGPLSGLCLLLVEDNEINQQLARNILQRAGARVAVAADGRGAVNILERQPTRFDAVLMDIRMPGMGGCEATRVIRGRLNLTLPVIAMTAATRDEDRDQAAAAGMNAHVAKPIVPQALILTLLAQVPGAGGGFSRVFSPEPGVSASVAWDDISLPIDLAGIDLRTALIRLGGDRRLWASLMRQFEASQGKVIGKVRELLASGQGREAAALMHQLRGVAANLGAVAVARRAVEIETAAKDGPREALPFLLAGLEGEMAEVFDLARRLPEPTRRTTPGPIPTDLEKGLAELAAFLAANNLRAGAEFERLRPALAQVASPETVRELAGAIDALDFAKAAAVVINIGKK